MSLIFKGVNYKVLKKITTFKYVVYFLLFLCLISFSSSLAFGAGDKATVTVRIVFRLPTKAKVSANSLDEVLSTDDGRSENDISGGAVNKDDASSTPVVTVKQEVEKSADGESVLGRTGASSKKGSKEASADSSITGSVSIYYDDSI